jgi:hypothetical protein
MVWIHYEWNKKLNLFYAPPQYYAKSKLFEIMHHSRICKIGMAGEGCCE